MSFQLVYKDPYNGKLRSLPVPLADIPPVKVRGTIAEFKALFKYALPPEEEGVHYMLIRVLPEETTDGLSTE